MSGESRESGDVQRQYAAQLATRQFTSDAEQLTVAKLNIDDNPETARRYGVLSIPTLIVFKDGQEKARVVGARGKDAILREIEPHFAA